MDFYWLFNHKTDYHKIGITKNIKKRKKILENQSGVKLKLIARIQSESAPQLELLIHNFFKSSRKRGEWFDLNYFHQIWLMKFLQNFIQIHVHANGFTQSLRPGTIWAEYDFSWDIDKNWRNDEKLIEWFDKTYPELKDNINE